MSKAQLTVYCDGGARGNPGPSAAAFVATRENVVLHKASEFLGRRTNNFAEYRAVILALKWLVKNKQLSGETGVDIVVDSQLIKSQLTGQYKVKSKSLLPLYLEARSLGKDFDGHINYKWSPRDKNKLADFLVNEELDRSV